MLSLSDDPSKTRRLREIEFSFISQQVFLPALSPVLPALPSRIGDRWQVPRGAVRALLGPRIATNEVVLATFKDLRTAAKGGELVAIIGVTAETNPFQAEIRVLLFSPRGPGRRQPGFRPSTPEAPSPSLSLAQVMTTPLPDSNGRLHQTQTRELIVARQRDETGPC